MPEKVTVYLGDSIPSIAVEKGFFWRTIWDFGANADLKAKRKNPNVLKPGDEVVLPDKTTKVVNKPVDAKHKFKRKGEPSMLRLKYQLDDEARANESYQLNIDNGRVTKNGNLDGDGMLQEVIPGDAKVAVVMFKAGKEIYRYAIGNLNPIDTISGVQQRLNNLGFNAGPEDNEMNDQLRDAITRFKGKYNLSPQDGEITEAVRSKLLELTQ